MVIRRILLTWLAFGATLGVVGGAQVYVATGRRDPVLVMVGLGLAIGVVGGIARLLVERQRGHLSGEPEQFAWTASGSDRLLVVIAAALAIGAGFARAAGAPWGVYVLLLAIAVLVSARRILQRRRSGR